MITGGNAGFQSGRKRTVVIGDNVFYDTKPLLFEMYKYRLNKSIKVDKS